MSASWIRKKKESTYQVFSPKSSGSRPTSARLRNATRASSRRVSSARRSRIQERIDQAREAAANGVGNGDVHIDTEETYRGRDDTTLTRREHLAFSPVGQIGNHKRDQLAENILKEIRAKIRADAYVGTEGEDLLATFARLDGTRIRERSLSKCCKSCITCSSQCSLNMCQEEER